MAHSSRATAATGEGIHLGNYFGNFEGEDIYTVSDGNRVIIGETGAVSGQGVAAINILGSNNHISNLGQIVGGDGAAIFFRAGNANRIQNDGSIIGGNTAIDFSGTVNTMVVTGNNFVNNTGVIEALGTLAAAGVAIRGSFATDTVLNSGIIAGNLLLSFGNDSYEGEGGRIIGTIDLGDGADVALGGAGREHVIGGTGDDTFDGGAGNDIFETSAGDGDDDLDGGAGVDLYSAANSMQSVEVDLANGFAFGAQRSVSTTSMVLRMLQEVAWSINCPGTARRTGSPEMVAATSCMVPAATIACSAVPGPTSSLARPDVTYYVAVQTPINFSSSLCRRVRSIAPDATSSWTLKMDSI